MLKPYNQLIDQIDELSGKLSAHYSKHLVCRSGCSGCCHHHLSVFKVEADAIREAIKKLPTDIITRITNQAVEVRRMEQSDQPVSCPMLIDDRCAIYQSRPLICRTQGLPLSIETEDGEQEVDYCPLNFTAPDAIDDLDEDHLVPLDAVNLKLAIVNLQYSGGPGKESIVEREKMAEIILNP